jgi:flagellar capping protein FliD
MPEINTTNNNAPGNTGASRPNVLPGLASGLNTNNVVEGLLQLERKRLEPIQERKAQSKAELDGFTQVKATLDELKGTLEALASNTIWEGKLVESSDENVVTATATAGARPGKHTMVVDRLALNHQISSQGYATGDTAVGAGRMLITVGDEAPVTVVIDQTNNTLEGLKDAINSATKLVQATIIKTGNQQKPYQLVLTSQKTGAAGKIGLEIQLRGGETPNFSNHVEDPTDWKGVGAQEARGKAPTGTGASNTIIRVVGEYAGPKDKTFTFTAVQTGSVGGEGSLQMRWKASTGESGVLQLDSFNYAAGQPAPFADGLSLVLSEGDVIVGDSFTVKARAEKSDLFWWLPSDDRKAGYSQPSRWQRQDTAGGPKISGDYNGEDDQKFKLTVEGSGQIGFSSNLRVRWDAANGDSGVLNIGRGYEPGSPLALVDGLQLTLDPGVLNEGDKASFSVAAPGESSRWWLDDDERKVASKIESVSKWTPGAKKAEEELGVEPQFPETFGPRVSNSKVKVSGEYKSDEPRVYTFTALRDGTIGTTKDFAIKWEDDKGHSGELRVGDAYPAESALPFDEGLAVAFGPGQVFKDDSFTIRTLTSTIQPAQDAKIRLGATEFGGGLEITSTTNDLDNVIEGVKLHLAASSETPVTVTIKGDTEKAATNALQFAQQFNKFATLVNDLTKFDRDNNVAGPLLSNRDIDNIRREVTELMVNPVPGLPQRSNMLFTLGLKLNDKGLLNIDENTLRGKIGDDFGAVADLFRNKGTTGNTGVEVVGITDDTQSNANGYPVEITQLPSPGSYTTPAFVQPIVIDGSNDKFFLTVDGRRSNAISIEHGVYDPGRYATALQNLITNDSAIGGRKVRVLKDGNQIRVISGNFGSKSTVEFAPVQDGILPGAGLTGGASTSGGDVGGTIDGEPADGLGQILRGSDKSKKVKGLRLLVTLTDKQLNANGAEALVKVTKGVASRMSAYVTRVVDPLRGDMKRITDGLRTRIKTYDGQLVDINGRIDRKRKDLQERFAKLETQMSTLKSQQSYMQTQLASLPGGGGGGSGIPGLPGM